MIDESSVELTLVELALLGVGLSSSGSCRAHSSRGDLGLFLYHGAEHHLAKESLLAR